MDLVVGFSDPMADVPAETRERLLKALEEVAASLAEIPISSAVWQSIESAPMHLDMDGWRFIYSVSREKRTLRVIEHKEIKARDPIAGRLRSHRGEEE